MRGVACDFWEAGNILSLNFTGIISGVAMIILTGIFHPVVVKCEYYFSARVWPVFLVMGLISCGVSLFSVNESVSSVAGILGAILLWCIRELKEQEKRVKKGWFPKNPNRKDA